MKVVHLKAVDIQVVNLQVVNLNLADGDCNWLEYGYVFA